MAKKVTKTVEAPVKIEAPAIVDVKADNVEAPTKVEQTPVRKTRMELDRNVMVEVMNSTKGQFVYVSRRTGQGWHLENYGSRDWMDVGELMTIRSSHSVVLNEPMLIILDDEVVEALGLSNLYETILDEEGVNRFFTLPVDEMEEVLMKAPVGMKRLLTQKALEMIENGELDSVSKRRLFERVFNIEIVD